MPALPAADPANAADAAALERALVEVATDAPTEQIVRRAASAPATDPEPSVLPLSRRALRRAIIRGLKPLLAVDTAVFLDINQLPHPRWMNAVMRFVTFAMRGAHALALGVFIAALREPKSGARVLAETLPPLWVTTAIMEVPVKKFFRRRRPFMEVLRAIVVGRKPESFSFPSGHSAAAFAGAALLRRQYPRWGWAFYGLAMVVGFSRIYLGAHYPADVLTGAVGGTVLAESAGALWRRPARGLAAVLYPMLWFLRWLVR